MVGDLRIPDLLYADDTALIAGISTDTEVDFVQAQRDLDLLCDFCDMFGMKINVNKSKGMEFRPCRSQPAPSFPLTFRGTPIPRVDKFLYMGVWFESAKTLYQSHPSTIWDLGRQALFGMLGRCKVLGIHRASLKSRLFKVLVRSAFSHACPIWGISLFKDSSTAHVLIGTKVSNPGEQVQLMFLRGLAGVGKHVHSLSLLHEFGHHPMMHYYVKLAARFWNTSIAASPSSLIHQAMLADVDLYLAGCRTCWFAYFISAMKALDMCALPVISRASCSTLRISIPSLVLTLQRRAQAYCSPPVGDVIRCPRQCLSLNVMGHTYHYWVGMLVGCAAPHIAIGIPAAARISLIRLRLACSPLAVVTGRMTATARSHRHCKVCTGCAGFALAHPFFPHFLPLPCEDICHFLLECSLYDVIRRDPFFAPVFSAQWSDSSLVTPAAARLRALFSTPHQLLLAHCVHRMFDLRSAVLSGASCWGSPSLYMPQTGHVFITGWSFHTIPHNLSHDSF
jgi:hypothetical protein